MNKKFVVHGEFVMPVGLIACALFFLVEGRGFRGNTAVFPRMMAIMLLVFSLFLLWQAFGKNREAKEKLVRGEEVKGLITLPSAKITLSCLGILLGYVFAILYIGYFVSTTVFMLGFMRVQKCRKWRTMILVTVVLEISIYCIFVYWLNIRLPRGILI